MFSCSSAELNIGLLLCESCFIPAGYWSCTCLLQLVEHRLQLIGMETSVWRPVSCVRQVAVVVCLVAVMFIIIVAAAIVVFVLMMMVVVVVMLTVAVVAVVIMTLAVMTVVVMFRVVPAVIVVVFLVMLLVVQVVVPIVVMLFVVSVVVLMMVMAAATQSRCLVVQLLLQSADFPLQQLRQGAGVGCGRVSFLLRPRTEARGRILRNFQVCSTSLLLVQHKQICRTSVTWRVSACGVTVTPGVRPLDWK